MTTIDSLNERAVSNIRAEMGRRRLTQVELADRLKWGRTALTELLNGNVQMTLIKLEQIADVLQVEPSKLLNS